MSLWGVLGPGERLSAAELALDSRDQGVVAFFDGHTQAQNGGRPYFDFPRRLTQDEAASWREGYAEGRRERLCQERHGFGPCTC